VARTERQALVNDLLVAVQQERFHVAPGLEEQQAKSRALLGYRRQVREDGLIGSELFVALLLALSTCRYARSMDPGPPAPTLSAPMPRAARHGR
jgi:hypothetical protein